MRNPALPAVIALLVFGCFNTFSHSSPHLLGLLLCAATCRTACRSEKKPLPRFSAASGTIVIPAAFILAVIVPSALVCRAEQAHIAGDTREGFYEYALTWPWPAYRAHESYAIALLDKGLHTQARAHLEKALHGADTGRIHLLFTVCASALGDNEAAYIHALACVYRWPGNDCAWSALLENCPEAQRPQWQQAREKFERTRGK